MVGKLQTKIIPPVTFPPEIKENPEGTFLKQLLQYS
jgi:hypothetical protein